MTILALVQPGAVPKPDPDRERAKQRRNRCEDELRKAFADSLAEVGWQATCETLGAELEAHADEAGQFREIWDMRSRAIFELSAETDLR